MSLSASQALQLGAAVWAAITNLEEEGLTVFFEDTALVINDGYIDMDAALADDLREQLYADRELA